MCINLFSLCVWSHNSMKILKMTQMKTVRMLSTLIFCFTLAYFQSTKFYPKILDLLPFGSRQFISFLLRTMATSAGSQTCDLQKAVMQSSAHQTRHPPLHGWPSISCQCKSARVGDRGQPRQKPTTTGNRLDKLHQQDTALTSSTQEQHLGLIQFLFQT